MKNKKLLTILGVLAFLTVVAIGIYKYRPRSTDDNDIRIGAVLTLSGNVSYWSYELKKGMDIAAEFINSDTNASCEIRIVYEDNAFNPQRAISACKKLLLTEDIDVFVSCFTPMCQAVSPICRESNKPILLTITSATDIAANQDGVYRDYITQQQQCPPLAEYVFNDMGMHRGVFLVLADDYGRDGVSEFSNRFSELGGDIQTGEFFSTSDLSIKDPVQKILSEDPEFVFVIAGAQPLLNACKQIREINEKVQIVGLTAFDSDDVWQSLGEIGNGVVFSSSYFEQTTNNARFFTAFQNRNKRMPNATNIYGFSIVEYLYELGVKSRLTQCSIQQLLAQMDNVESIRGVLHMNENHDVISPIGIYQRENGKSVIKKVVK